MSALRFIPSEYESGRIAARSGIVTVGAIFPALNQPGSRWRWRLWVSGSTTVQDGEATSELSAKNAICNAWADFLRAADLREASQ